MRKSVSLKKFKVARFGCLPEGLEIDFEPQGLHIIAGPNESGKSTIMTAILAVLFGDIDARDYFPWGAPPDINFSALLELYCSDSSILRIHKDFKKYYTEVILIDKENRKNVLFRDTIRPRSSKPSVKEYNVILEERFGFSGSDFFTRIHFIRQEDMLIQIEDTFLHQVGIGEKSDLLTALNSLENRHKGLTRNSEFFGHPARNDRKIEILQKEISALEERRASALSQRQQTTDLRKKINEINEEIANKEKTIAELEKSIELENELFRLIEQRDKLRENLGRLRQQREQIEDIKKQIKETEEKIDREFSVFKSASEKTIESLNEISQLEQSLQEKHQILKSAEKNLGLKQSMIEKLEKELHEKKTRVPVDTQSLAQIKSLLEKYESVNKLDEEIIRQRNLLKIENKKTSIVLLIGILGLIITAAGVMLPKLLPAIIPGVALLGFSIFKGVKTFSVRTAKKHLIASNEEKKVKINNDISATKTAMPTDVQNVLEEIMQGKLQLNELEEQLKDTIELTNKCQVEKGVLNKLQEEYTALKKEVERKEEHLNTLRQEYGSFIINNDIPLTQSKYREYLTLKSKRETLMDRLSKEPSYDEIVRKERELELDYNAVFNSLQDFIKRYPPMKYLKEKIESNPTEATQVLENKKEKLKTEKRELERLKDEERELRADLEVIAKTGETESADSLKGMIEDKRSQLNQLKRQAEAIKLAAITLREALSNFEKNYAQKIIATASATFNAITNGRYQSLQRKDGRLFLITSEGEMITPDRISQGARDQLYLSLRLALAETLSSKIKIPLILDDPFVHCDAERLQAIKKLFSHLASDWQILLFTCQPERFQDWGKTVLQFS